MADVRRTHERAMAVRRRDVLKGLSAALSFGGALMLADARAQPGGSPMGRTEIRQHIRKALGTIFFNDDLEPHMIGRAYLSLHPEEAHIDRLLTELPGVCVPQRMHELESRLVELRQQDFEDGEVAIVEGWILANTEARACALLTLL